MRKHIDNSSDLLAKMKTRKKLSILTVKVGCISTVPDASCIGAHLFQLGFMHVASNFLQRVSPISSNRFL